MKEIILFVMFFATIFGFAAFADAAGPFAAPGGAVSPRLRTTINRYAPAFYPTPIFRAPGGAR